MLEAIDLQYVNMMFSLIAADIAQGIEFTGSCYDYSSYYVLETCTQNY